MEPIRIGLFPLVRHPPVFTEVEANEWLSQPRKQLRRSLRDVPESASCLTGMPSCGIDQSSELLNPKVISGAT